MSECPTRRAIILRKSEPYYKNEVEQEENYIEGVDSFDENAEGVENPCDGVLTVPNMLANKVPIEEVLPQERELSIPFFVG